MGRLVVSAKKKYPSSRRKNKKLARRQDVVKETTINREHHERQDSGHPVEREAVSVSFCDIAHDHDYYSPVSTEPSDLNYYTEEIIEQNMENHTDDIVLCQDSEHVLSEDEFIIERTQPEASKGDKILQDGRRIVDLYYLCNEIAKLCKHAPFNCTFSDMYPISEKRMGMNSLIIFKCRMCNIEKKITTCESTLYVNKGLVLGTLSSGSGYATSDTIMSCLNVPFMSEKTYYRYEHTLADIVHDVAWKTIEDAGKEEAEAAKDLGEVDENGVPLITVVADGAWSKRSYSTNYNAASGVACIIGARMRKILFLGIRNKYCCICSRAESKQVDIPEHRCYKNWSSTSTSMEADIIVEGFKRSIELHGVIFKRLVGDGDSSVYTKLLDTRPYGRVFVEKIECKNHLLRNFSKKIRDICGRKKSNSKNLLVVPALRKMVEKSAKHLRVDILSAVSHRIKEQTDFTEKVECLKKDLSNVASHVFGEHKLCPELQYFHCNKGGKETNYVPEMKECGLFTDIEVCFNRLIYNAQSLIMNMDTNVAEQYNSIVCKFVGGKRVNYSQRRSYTTRCEAAAISFNTKGDYFLSLTDELDLKRTYVQKYVQKIKSMRALKSKQPMRRKIKKVARPDKDYGLEDHVIPDLPDLQIHDIG